MYTIRQCIKEMRRTGNPIIHLNNGTTISIEELSARPEEQPFSRLKGKDLVMRRILCRIIANDRTQMMDELKSNENWWCYDPKEEMDGCSFFARDEFLLPERVMNAFIFANGGIDHYSSVTIYDYMIADMDTIDMMEEL